MQGSSGLLVTAASPDGLLERTEQLIRQGAFVIEKDVMDDLAQELGMPQESVLVELLSPATSLARPPISAFRVGAVGLGCSGRAYIGVNLEFQELPLNNSVHAEQFLLMNAMHHGERRIDVLAVSAPPCGHCRQFYCETANSDTIRFRFGSPTFSEYRLADLLPQRFGPKDLLPAPLPPLLLERRENGLELSAAATEALLDRAGEPALSTAVERALQEANRSYAPYSSCPSGLALVTVEGAVYSGCYAESAAYNPSVAPLQAAIIAGVVDGMPCYTRVADVVLVEMDGARVQHAHTTRTKLHMIAPAARITVLHAVRRGEAAPAG